MFPSSHQQGQHPRLNGMGAGQRLPMGMYNYQQQNHQQHHPPSHQHQSIQQDHSGHGNNANVLGHHSGYSSGLLSNAAPFTPSSHQNGHASNARSGQAQQYNEHWQEQLRSYKESQQAHAIMTEQHQPHYFARLRAAENRGVAPPQSAGDSTDGDTEDRARPVSLEKSGERQEWKSLDCSGQGLRNISLPLFSAAYGFIEDLYLASNNLTYLPSEIGQLRQLRHLDVSHNQLRALPPELGMCTLLKQFLFYENSITELPSELGSLHSLDILGVQGNPLNAELKQKLIDDGTKSLISYLKETSPVPLPPQPRQNIIIQEDVAPSLERLKVFSWNVLCDRAATTQQYGYTPTSALNWDYRKDNIMQEIRERDADIFCLQEIAIEAHENFFTPELARHDYKSVFWPKTRVKHLLPKDTKHVDGCATFYRASKYILLDKHVIEFAQIAINRPDMKSQVDVFNRVMPKDNIATICFFESRQTGARFIVVNAHLCWEAHLADVKAIQTGILMEFVTKQAERYTRMPPVPLNEKKLTESLPSEDGAEMPQDTKDPAPSQEYRNNTDIPLLVCGDFNSTFRSSVYELLSTGRVPPDHADLGQFRYGHFTSDGIEHPFSLRSAYAHLSGTPDELAFTNYTPSFVDVIDYVFYSTNTLEAVEVLGPPDYQYLKRVPGFPNYHFPSDHLQIMSEFVFKARKDKKALPDRDSGAPGLSRM